jgi:hypothetical protein
MDYKEELKKALEGIDESRFAKLTDNQLAWYDSRNGLPHSDVHKKRIGLAHKGKKLSLKEVERVKNMNIGRVHSEETKDKLKENARITKQYLKAAQVWSQKPEEFKKEVGKKSGQSRVGRLASDEHKDNISKGLKGKPKSKEHKEKLSISRTGKKMDEEQKKRYKLLFKGERNPMYGKTHTEETRKKISNNPAYKIERTCPHCNKTIIGTNYFRHHGDRCKLNPNKTI